MTATDPEQQQERELFLRALNAEYGQEHTVSEEDRQLFEEWLEQEKAPSPAEKGVEQPEIPVSGKRPKYCQAEIDLHGLTRAEADPRLYRFLENCRSQQLQLVRVITGKGLHSQSNKPVLRDHIRRGLQTGRYGPVRSVRRAKAREGGSGALLIQLP